MDYFNDLNPIYPPNPDTVGLSDSDVSERNDIIEKIYLRKRKRRVNFDDFCTLYSDELWHLWCVIQENSIYSGLLNKLSYPTFCSTCYENTS